MLEHIGNCPNCGAPIYGLARFDPDREAAVCVVRGWVEYMCDCHEWLQVDPAGTFRYGNSNGSSTADDWRGSR